MRRSTRLVMSLSALAFLAQAATAATPIATYEFNNNFNAQESGKPALTVTDPGNLSAFETDTVFGTPRTVWDFTAASSANADQAGVTLNTTGLISPTSYSVDMVFQFTQRDGAWRRIIDVQNRQSDGGFYVDPSNNLDVYPVAGSSAQWTNNVYHHVVMTNTGTEVKGYIDGVSQFTATTDTLDLNNPNNPSLLMGFFLDNVVAGGQGEYSNGKVSLVRVWDGVLTDQEASTLATNPFVPEPATLATLGAAGCVGLIRRRRDR